ncbi:hypothetical protein ACPB9E_17690 [Streptomyces exfoliatus]|uniref:hypothetical protein n=1 Tax=Streptomyces exfoliatus TaxID=1905 RepID=UPI003C2B014D
MDVAQVVVPVLKWCVKIERTMSARPATVREAELMGRPYGTMVLVMVFTAVQRDVEGNPLSVTETAMVGSHELPDGFLPPMLSRIEED